MTDSNITNLLNNEEEEEKKKIETPETDALFQSFDNQPLSSVSKAINKSQAGVVDFFDNKFLGNQRSFEEILENRSRIINESREKQEKVSEEITKTPQSQILRGAITGPLKAINETVEFADDIYDYLAGNPYDNNDLIDYSYFEREDDGAFYQIPQAITQFLLPMGIFTKGLKGIKNPWTRNLIAGFLTDFVVEDPYEQNLYNMVDSYEGALEPVVDVLKMPASVFKADDDVSPIEARLRKAFGGAVIGEALTGLSVALKGFRNSPLAPKILQTLEAKRKLKFKDLGIDEAGNELLDEQVIDLLKPLEVKKGQGIGDTTQIPQVGEKIESTFNPNITGGGVDQLTEYLINISEYFKSTDELGKWARSVSLGDMFAASQRQTNKEALEAAQFFLQEFGPIIKTSDGKIINNPKYLPATSITINQMMNKNGEAVFNLSAALHNGIVGKNPDLVKSIKKEFIEEVKVLRGLVYLNKGVGSLTSQSLGARRIAGDLRDVKVTAEDFSKKSRGTENIEDLNKKFIEDAGIDEIDQTFNQIFDLVEQGDEEAALALTRLTKYLNIAGGNPEVMKRMVKKGLLLKGVEFTNEIFINSILSGPPTHVVNVLSTSLNTLVKPLTQSAGAAKIVFRKDPNIGYGRSILQQPSNLTFRPEFNTDEFVKGWKQFIYMAESLGDAFNIAGKAFKANENVLDRGAMIQDAQRVSRNINAEDVRNFADSNVVTQATVKPFVDLFIADAWIPSIYNTFRNINGFGSRMLITEDEFLKQVNFRAYVKAEAWEQGIKKGKQGVDLTNYIQQQSEKVFKIVDTGSTKKLPQSIQDLYKKAKDYATEATFTKDLPQDSFGKKIQDFASHPYGRLIFPFVRTPLNIFKTQIRFTPVVNLALQEYRQALKSTDPSVAARARGEMYLGGGFLVSAALMAREIDNPFAEMAITGGGPNVVGFGDAIEANRQLVKQKQAEGWQPYSIRFLVRDSNGQPVITKSGKPKYKYISFKRLDPWSGTLMFLADFVDIEGQIGSQQKNDIATALTVAIGRNITDRTYIRGLTEFAESIHNPFKMQTLLARRAANIINPVSGLGRSIQRATDKTKLDTTYYPADEMITGLRQTLNELARTIPFYNANLEPDRNWLTGAVVEYPSGFGPDTFDVLNPFTATTSKDNYVLSVINDLNISLQPPKKFFFRKQGIQGSGIELTSKQYADYVKYLAFDTKIDGKRLIVKLYEILNSSENKALYKTAMGENINSTNQEIMVGIQDNARAKLSRAIKNEVSDYKIKARTEWLGKPENQELFGDFTGKLEEINNGTIESTIKNLSNF
jgi:flagellar hook-basal body complex protein FliE